MREELFHFIYFSSEIFAEFVHFRSLLVFGAVAKRGLLRARLATRADAHCRQQHRSSTFPLFLHDPVHAVVIVWFGVLLATARISIPRLSCASFFFFLERKLPAKSCDMLWHG